MAQTRVCPSPRYRYMSYNVTALGTIASITIGLFAHLREALLHQRQDAIAVCDLPGMVRARHLAHVQQHAGVVKPLGRAVRSDGFVEVGLDAERLEAVRGGSRGVRHGEPRLLRHQQGGGPRGPPARPNVHPGQRVQIIRSVSYPPPKIRNS
eukprot:233293-Prorocentrum_minimum.AAC.1